MKTDSSAEVRDVPRRAPASQGAPHFLIVGTPRSGTTLVQRLASELPGIAMPPETHFFSLFVPELVHRRRLPLDRVALREELQRYGAMKTSRGLDLEVEVIIEALDGRCDSLVELFGVLVSHLAGEGVIYGEKTPAHVRWWRRLTEALPELKIIAVVRDPRAVVASNLEMPWGMKSPVAVAEMWRCDQRLIRQAREALGRDRCRVLRYEDVVSDPDAARKALGALLMTGESEHSVGTPSSTASSSFVHSWEWWKQGVHAKVTTERVEAWRKHLTPGQAAAIAAICGSEMQRFGYSQAVPDPFATAFRLLRLGPADHRRRHRLRRGRRQQLAWIERVCLQAPQMTDEPPADGSRRS